MPRFRKEKRQHDDSAAEQRARVLMSTYDGFSPSDGSFEIPIDQTPAAEPVETESVTNFGKLALGISLGGAIGYLAYRYLDSTLEHDSDL